MADWEAIPDTSEKNSYENLSFNHSRQSSASSGLSSANKENHAQNRKSSLNSADSTTTDNSSEKELILKGGSELTEESRTEFQNIYENSHALKNGVGETPGVPNRHPIQTGSAGTGTAKAKAAKSPYSAGPIDSIPEEEITIPNDANISSYTIDQLANFLRCLKIDDRIISHLHRKSVDGKRFSKFKDSELETLSMKNPVVLFFRDKSSVKSKKKAPFML